MGSERLLEKQLIGVYSPKLKNAPESSNATKNYFKNALFLYLNR